MIVLIHSHTHTHILLILLHISRIQGFRANCLHRVGDLRMGDMALVELLTVFILQR